MDEANDGHGASPPPQRGIIYLAMGKRFVAEAILSATSARRHLSLPITVFTDYPSQAQAANVFDSVVELQQSAPRAHRDKIVAMRRTPYAQTLFLDTDTFVGAPMDDCWDLLDYFDMAVSGDRAYVDDFPPGTGVPASFKEPNVGVVFYRQSPAMERMLDESLVLYDDLATRRTSTGELYFRAQPPIRLILYRASLRVAPLTDEDNCRFANYGKLNGPVRVLHGRLGRAAHTAENLQRVLDRLNATTVPRVFVAGRAWVLGRWRLQLTHQYRAARMRSFNVVEVQAVISALRSRVRRRLGW